MSDTVRYAIKMLLLVVEQLRSKYPKKRFTLDGRLVGDIGEVLVDGEYDVELFEGLVKHHDAMTHDGRQLQIKATMQTGLTFPVDNVPDYYLGIKIYSDGTFTEIFNGPGSIAAKAVKNRAPTKTNLHYITINALKLLNEEVQENDRIPRRTD